MNTGKSFCGVCGSRLVPGQEVCYLCKSIVSEERHCADCGNKLTLNGWCDKCKAWSALYDKEQEDLRNKADAEAKSVMSGLRAEDDRFYGNQDAKLLTGPRCSRCGSALPESCECNACG